MSIRIWTGAAVLFATFTLPQHIYKAAPQGFDTVIGRAAISVIRTDSAGTLIRPVMPPTFLMAHLKGESQIAPGFAICTVIKRIVYVDDAEKRFFVTTVLKCGGTEFYMKDVLFEVEKLR